jgi:hypothetical protein
MQDRFVADAMLGRLARWLRVLGFDTLYDTALHDPALVRIADAEGRVLLTRDRLLLRELRPARSLEIRHDRPLEQLHAVVEALALDPPVELFTRCMVCNTLLSEDIAGDAALQLLPPDFDERPPFVRLCTGCGRVYWFGSHTRRMRITLERALPGWLSRGPDAAK